MKRGRGDKDSPSDGRKKGGVSLFAKKTERSGGGQGTKDFHSEEETTLLLKAVPISRKKRVIGSRLFSRDENNGENEKKRSANRGRKGRAPPSERERGL